MVSTADNLVGVGLYTPSEAARYARVTTGLMSRWMFGTSRDERVVRPQLANDENRTLTFLDFVQALAIRVIRNEHKVPLQKIREAIRTAEERYEMLYPFARRHQTFLYGKDIHVVPDDMPDDTLVQVTGKRRHQMVLRKVIEPFMHNLTFDDEGLARRFRAFQYHDFVVTLDPSIVFGQPRINQCQYTVQSLISAVETEGDVERAAEVLGIDRDYIIAAIQYDDHLRGNAAA